MVNVERLIAYEQNALTDMELLQLFSDLIKSGEVWSLQGHYGRMAHLLMDDGFIDKDGNLNYSIINELLGQ